MHNESPAQPDALGLKIGIAVSRYHPEITNQLLEGAKRVYLANGGQEQGLIVVQTPGAYELTAVCRTMAEIGTFDAAVALGCVITGETNHDQYINQGVVQGLTSITCATGMPVGFGVLTCQTLEQARARAGGTIGNKGEETMSATIETVNSLRKLWEQEGDD